LDSACASAAEPLARAGMRQAASSPSLLGMAGGGAAAATTELAEGHQGASGGETSTQWAGAPHHVGSIISTSSVISSFSRVTRLSRPSVALLEPGVSFSSGILAEQFEEENIAPEDLGSMPVPKRVYYLDWLRIVAIYLVFMYHCIQYLAVAGVWKDPELNAVTAYKCLSLQVGMPVFFHISGRAQALARQATLRDTVVRRLQRLVLPFFACYILLIPIWQALRGEPLDLESWFVHHKLTFDIGWLWFLPTLFLVSVFNAPLILFAHGGDKRKLYAAIVAALWVVMAVGVLLLGFSFWFVFFAALGPLVSMAVVCWEPFPSPREDAQTWKARRWLAVVIVTLAQIFAQVGLVCSFRYQDMKDGLIPEAAKPLPAAILFIGLYAQGYFVQRWNVPELREDESRARELRAGDLEMRATPMSTGPNFGGVSATTTLTLGSEPIGGEQPSGGNRGVASSRICSPDEWGTIGPRLWNVFLGGSFILAWSLGNDLGRYEEELFPIYSASFLETPYFAAVHVIGTWAYIGITVPWFKANLDQEIHPDIYKHLSASTMLAYLFHSVFIVFFVFIVVEHCDLKHGFWKVFNPIWVLLAAMGLCAGLYYLLLKYVPRLGVLFGL